MRPLVGTIYLVHFDRPLAHARHYIGWASDLDARLAEHRAGRGARLLQVLNELGIGYVVARTWTGTRHDERRLKRGRRAPRLCPLCTAPARTDGGPTVQRPLRVALVDAATEPDRDRRRQLVEGVVAYLRFRCRLTYRQIAALALDAGISASRWEELLQEVDDGP